MKIDPEFKALIPPLAPDEYAQLEANILAEGCRDPLVVWAVPPEETWWTDEGWQFTDTIIPDAEIESEDLFRYENETVVLFRCGRLVFVKTRSRGEYQVDEWRHEWRPGVKMLDEESTEEETYVEACDNPEYILIDGHNRHEICTRHAIEFQTVERSFSDRSHAVEWIILNQFGRRNLPAYERSKLALRLEDTIAARAKGNQSAGGGDQKSGLQKSAKPITPIDTRQELAKIAGVSHDTIAKVKKIEAVAPPEIKQALARQEISINQAHQQITRVEKEQKREQRREENRAKVAEVSKPDDIIKVGAKFATIVIDPPWDWGDEGDQDQLGRARPDYATMSIDELCKLPVGELADTDCHLYLWITNRSLPKGFRLMEAWGFRYITAITWAKPHFGMGNYFRGQTEHILFGVKGSQPLMRKDVGTIFTAQRGPNGHSSKPTEFYELVESCSPGPHLEMFSRCERDGWKTWGQES